MPTGPIRYRPAALGHGGVLSLQRAVGNRATAGHLRGAAPTVQRKLKLTSADLPKPSLTAKTRSISNDSTYVTILEKLDRYHRSATELDAQLECIDAIIQLSDKWMLKHPKVAGPAPVAAPVASTKNMKKAAKFDAVNNLRIHAGAEKAVLAEQRAYLDDLKTSADSTTNAAKSPFKWLSQPARQYAIPQATALAAGKTTDSEGARKAALDLVRRRGLNEAEVAALKTYTVDDFKYINPALSQNAGLLARDLGKVLGPKGGLDAKDATHQKSAATEGERHGKVAMSALEKLEPTPATLYRGFKPTEQQFNANYFEHHLLNFNYLFSTSRDRTVSERFADPESNGSDKDKVSVVFVIAAETSRDVSQLSLVEKEAEHLLLPPVNLMITGIHPLKHDPTRIKAAYEVHVKEIPNKKATP